MSNLPPFPPDDAFDPTKFEPVEPDWLNTGVRASKNDVLARGHNDRDGFWRPDVLPGLNPRTMGREKWNPLECDLGNSYLADAHWHPFQDDQAQHDDRFVPTMDPKYYRSDV